VGADVAEVLEASTVDVAAEEASVAVVVVVVAEVVRVASGRVVATEVGVARGGNSGDDHNHKRNTGCENVINLCFR
jgi:hypothetical protein